MAPRHSAANANSSVSVSSTKRAGDWHISRMSVGTVSGSTSCTRVCARLAARRRRRSRGGRSAGRPRAPGASIAAAAPALWSCCSRAAMPSPPHTATLSPSACDARALRRTPCSSSFCTLCVYWRSRRLARADSSAVAESGGPSSSVVSNELPRRRARTFSAFRTLRSSNREEPSERAILKAPLPQPRAALPPLAGARNRSDAFAACACLRFELNSKLAPHPSSATSQLHRSSTSCSRTTSRRCAASLAAPSRRLFLSQRATSDRGTAHRRVGTRSKLRTGWRCTKALMTASAC